MLIHFIGIGGIGVSALAKYYLSEGFSVFGSDLAGSGITDELAREGAEIFIGSHKAGNIKTGVDLVVYSAAVVNDNPELKEAKMRKMKCQTYAQALGDLTKKYFTIAVSGTHGKSTTTAMIALILIEAGLDPTVIVGTKVNWGSKGKISPDRSLLKRGGELSNFRAGKSKYLVIEADEYALSFLNYWPKIIVLTNIEEDHLDYYGNLKNILKAFGEYVWHLPKEGVLVANGEDENINKIFNFSPWGGFREGRQFSIFNKNPKYKIITFDSQTKIGGLNLKVPGRHNLMDAYAAICAARALKIPDGVSVSALNKFTGTWRRFEYKGKVNDASIYDDYGHHPTEIKATLEGARELLGCCPLDYSFSTTHSNPAAHSLIFSLMNRSKIKGESRRSSLIAQRAAMTAGAAGRLWCVFQPHQYQRTYKLFDQFVGAFDEADVLILLPIYSVAGREKESIKKKVSSEKLAEAIKNRFKNRDLRFKNKKIIYLGSFDKTAKYLRKNLKKGDMAVIMGAGDVYMLTVALLAGS